MSPQHVKLDVKLCSSLESRSTLVASIPGWGGTPPLLPPGPWKASAACCASMLPMCECPGRDDESESTDMARSFEYAGEDGKNELRPNGNGYAAAIEDENGEIGPDGDEGGTGSLEETKVWDEVKVAKDSGQQAVSHSRGSAIGV